MLELVRGLGAGSECTGWVLQAGAWGQEAARPGQEMRARALHSWWDSDRRDKRPHSLGESKAAFCPPRQPLGVCSQMPGHSTG